MTTHGWEQHIQWWAGLWVQRLRENTIKISSHSASTGIAQCLAQTGAFKSQDISEHSQHYGAMLWNVKDRYI